MKHIVLTLFFIYWCLTILFQFPKDSLLIGNLYKYKHNFDRYFFQNWSFFAPPPQSNYEIFYFFENEKKNTVLKVNLLENIHKNIQSNFPFNDSEIQMHYLFFVHSNSLITKAPNILDQIMYSNRKGLSEDDKRKKLYEYISRDRDYLFFINHAKKLKAKLNLNLNKYVKFRFEIYSHDINKYINRNKITKKNYDNYLFKSKTIKL